MLRDLGYWYQFRPHVQDLNSLYLSSNTQLPRRWWWVSLEKYWRYHYCLHSRLCCRVPSLQGLGASPLVSRFQSQTCFVSGNWAWECDSLFGRLPSASSIKKNFFLYRLSNIPVGFPALLCLRISYSILFNKLSVGQDHKLLSDLAGHCGNCSHLSSDG